MKKKSLNILIVALAVVAIFGGMLAIYVNDAKDSFAESITVDSDGVTETVVSVNDLTLIPTQRKDYTLSLQSEIEGTFDVVLDCEETRDGGMKQFVFVTVKSGDSVVYEGGLSDLLGDTDVMFQVEIDSETAVQLTICYEMPESVGNEAQGTSADFDIHIRIEKV
ncbi:MAG: hypothetical protein E7350_04845 [Clostridiales bacterium]|nr:hypothetical protein [Clostridiales bacterium]